MSYQVLARKYRSQSFDQLIGQTHISQTLKNALKNDRLPHALLFTGIRGTGKTSSARILAKTLRCENLQNFTPCNVCNSCLEISNGSAVDVIEIDGASNNGVDAIRDLRDSVMFMPTSGKYKIFIIDEVHMLSTNAFNALLKTLEEPPAHVIFMMATTEVQKIPQTILSRCQRFDLRRIPLKLLTEHLKNICALEKIEADEKALWLIAKQGDGSARDSLSLLDQVINFSSGYLTEKIVSDVLGLTDRELIFEIYHNLLARDPQAMIQSLSKAHLAGVNPALFIEELIQIIRHSILLKTSKTEFSANDNLINLPLEEIEILQQQVQTQSDSDLHMLFDMTLKSATDLLRASDPFLVFEICLLRMAQAPRLMDIQKFIRGSGTAPSASVTIAPKIQGLAKPAEPKPIQPLAPTPPIVVAKPKVDNAGWLQFVTFLNKENAFLAAKLENIIFTGLQDKTISLSASGSFVFLAEQLGLPETRQKLQGFIDSFFGPGYTFDVVKVKVATGDSAKSMSQKIETDTHEKLKSEILQDPRVQAAQRVFKATAKIIQKEQK